VDDSEVLVPIRMVESLAFCPRQAWYRFVTCHDRTNAHMERGLARHEVFDQAERPSGAVYRSVPVLAPSLGVQGVLDEVRIGEDELIITEVKTARLSRIVWPGIALQLAVQRLALAEHMDRGGWFGATPPARDRWRLRAYFTASRSYRDVAWGPELAGQARDAINRARQLMGSGDPPPGNVGRRCAHCQVLDDCLPFETVYLREAGL